MTKRDLPKIQGSDVAGTVASIGDGVRSVSVGDRVVLCPNLTCGTCRYCREGPENECASYGIYEGGFAEQCAVDAHRLVALPDEIGFVEAAALPIAYMTVWRMLRRADADPGDLVFIPGATGGVGTAAVQLTDMLGMRSIGSSTSQEKLDRLDEYGLTHGLRSGDPEELREAIEAIGEPDVVINHLSGPYTQLGLDVLRRGGRLVTCGRTAGQVAEIDMLELYWQHKRLIGSTMGTQGDLELVVDRVADGAFEPAVSQTFELEEAHEAFAAIADRTAFGKLIVRPS